MINTKIIKSQTQLTIILVVFTLSVFLIPISPFGDISDLTQSSNNKGNDDTTNLHYSSRTSTRTPSSISGVEDPRTVNQFANYNKTGVEVNVNGTSSIYLGSSWQMYRYQASVYNLTDTKEWVVNGSFEETYNPWINDSNDGGSYTNNMVTYWTGDPAHIDEPTPGDKCIYMQMDGNLTGGTYYYDLGDSAYWYEDILIDRDHPTYAALSFNYYFKQGYQGSPPKLDLRFFINDTEVYSFKLRNMVLTNWQTSGEITTVGFDTLASVLDNYVPGVVRFRVLLEATGNIGITGSGADSQQIYIDNVTLSMTSHAFPSTLNLQTRLRANNGNTGNFSIIGTNYGSGNIIINPSPYLTTTVTYEYVDVDYFTNSSNSVSLKCDMTSYAALFRTTQTDRQTLSPYGVKFSASNGTDVLWECYYLVSIPGDYGANFWNFTKPIDWNLTHIYNPSMVPVIGYVEGGGIGDNYVLINRSIGGSEGFWELHFSSPNYVEESWFQIQDGTSWYNTTFLLVGNMTRGVGQLLSRDFGQPQANLTVFDPLGNVWFSELGSVEASTGRVIFSNHLVTANTYGGPYTGVILWQNGTEAGYTYSTFLIIHNSDLKAKKTVYEFESTGEEISAYIKVYFKDLDNDGTDIYYPVHLPQKPSITGTWTEDRTIDFSWSVDEITGEAGYIGFYDLSGLSPGTYDTVITAAVEGYSDVSTGTPLNDTLQISFVLKEPSEAGGVSTTAFIGLATAVGIALVAFFTWHAHFRLPLIVRIINRNISQIKTGQTPPPSNMPPREERVKSLIDEGLKEDLKILEGI